MRRTLQIFDEFLPEAEAASLRQLCLSLPFGPVEYKGETYPNIGQLPREWTDYLHRLLDDAIGCAADLKLSFLRYSTEEDDTPHWIHADNGEAQYAVVYYLSEPGTGLEGTAFWQHRELKADEARLGITEAEVARVNADAHSSEPWRMAGIAQQRFNRLITYPCRLFHSRYPKHSPGHDLATGRLIWVAFYNQI